MESSYVHVGTTAGYYYVLDAKTGAVVKEIDCQEPIFSAPAVGSNRVYFATLGARVHAVEPSGEVAWTWDFVREVVKFDGNRWSGADWLASRKDRVTWRDHIICSRDLCLVGQTVVMPAGGLDAKDGSLVWWSDPVTSALNVVTVGGKLIFSNALRGKGNVFDRQTGRIVSSIGHNYACCRFTLSEPYVLGANMDMIDLSDNGKLVSTDPAVDSRECLGAVVSNGRVFYASQASGLVVSQTYGAESRTLSAVWQQ